MNINQSNFVFNEIEKPFNNFLFNNDAKKINTIIDNNTGNKKLEKALIGLGIAATAGIIIGSVVTHKPVSLDKISFDKGFATLKKNGKGFSGKIKDSLKNGDKIILKYKDGILQSSKRTGSKNFEKIYTYSNGDKIIKTITDGNVTIVNLTEKIAKDKEKAKKMAEIKAEAQRRTLAAQNADLAQERYNAPFKNALSNKNAKESAETFERAYQETIKAEAQKRTLAEQNAIKNANLAQEKYNAPFEKALSNKSAEESAQTLKTEIIKRKKSEVITNYNDDGSATKIIKDKYGTIKETIDSQGEITSRESCKEIILPNGEVKYTSGTTSFHDSGKLTTFSQNCPEGNSSSIKQYATNKKGKFEQIHRVRKTTDDNGNTTIKIVEKLENGNSQTIIEDVTQETRRVIIRDKKGNILSDKTNSLMESAGIYSSKKPPFDGSETALLDPWYIHYKDLCKKYNVPVRMCGITGGAADHHYELCLLDSNPKEYIKYMELQKQRAQYDPKARLMLYMNDLENNIVRENMNILPMMKKGELNIDDILLLLDADSNDVKEVAKYVLKALNNGTISREAAIAQLKAYEQGIINEQTVLKNLGIDVPNYLKTSIFDDMSDIILLDDEPTCNNFFTQSYSNDNYVYA